MIVFSENVNNDKNINSEIASEFNFDKLPQMVKQEPQIVLVKAELVDAMSNNEKVNNILPYQLRQKPDNKADPTQTTTPDYSSMDEKDEEMNFDNLQESSDDDGDWRSSNPSSAALARRSKKPNSLSTQLRGRIHKPTTSPVSNKSYDNISQSSNPSTPLGELMTQPKLHKTRVKSASLTPEERYRRRLEANRLAAQASRDRKKQKKSLLEKQVGSLEQIRKNTLLQVGELEKENEVLKTEYADLQRIIFEKIKSSAQPATFQEPLTNPKQMNSFLFSLMQQQLNNSGNNSNNSNKSFFVN